MIARLLNEHIVVALERQDRIVALPQVAESVHFEVAVAAARLATLLDAALSQTRRVRLDGRGQCVDFLAKLRLKIHKKKLTIFHKPLSCFESEKPT